MKYPLGKLPRECYPHSMRMMSPPVFQTLLATSATITGLFFASVAFAETGVGGRDAKDDRWVPSFSLYMAGLPEHRRASADSEVTPDQDSESVGFPWSIGSEVGLASPVIGSSRWKPRLTLHAGGGYVLDGTDPVSTNEDPGGFPTQNPSIPDPSSYGNQGTAVRAQAKPWVLTAGVGALFEFEAFERTIFVRPSLEWMYRKDTIEAVLGVVEGQVLVPPNSDCANYCDILFIQAQTEKGYHSLGGGLEAAVEGGRLGDFVMRFFLSGRIYGILGDRKTAISPVGTWVGDDGQPTLRPDTQTAFNARYERETVHYRFGVGMQFFWQPE